MIECKELAVKTRVQWRIATHQLGSNVVAVVEFGPIHYHRAGVAWGGALNIQPYHYRRGCRSDKAPIYKEGRSRRSMLASFHYLLIEVHHIYSVLYVHCLVIQSSSLNFL